MVKNITIDTAWLTSLGFTKMGDWLQIETLPGIYLAWDGEGLRLEGVMIPGPQTRQRVFDIFEAFGLDRPDDYSLTEAWLLGRGGKDTTHGVSIEISPSLFLSWSDTLGKLWLGGIELAGPYTQDRVLAIMNAIGMCQPQRFHSYYYKTGELWSCIGISEPVMALPPTQLYTARLESEDIAIFGRGQNTLVHARGIADHTLVILRRDGSAFVACPLETFKNDFTLKGA